ncbi:Leucine Rich Repeat [Seminavis robusta]|uniref:Leucine Rich Repeat n=1 Tax=Seminavis robusta TaxID=568900 RepID=A0A9N8HFW0_9STRA|nr:Leucine Rich Repeat [Seminavis robusta]|eukprot:Sro453_g146190.1 Leucine Rich Repeat (325) ;mRNA; f:48531-49782
MIPLTLSQRTGFLISTLRAKPRFRLSSLRRRRWLFFGAPPNRRQLPKTDAEGNENAGDCLYNCSISLTPPTRLNLFQMIRPRKRSIALILVFLCFGFTLCLAIAGMTMSIASQDHSIALSLVPTGLSFSESLPVYTQAALKDKTSPQSRALDWLSNRPGYPRLERWRKLQLYAIATFYFAYKGDQWWDNDQVRWWSHTVTECEWGDRGNGANTCDNGRITSLSLESQKERISGATTLPELALLSSLENLKISLTDLPTDLAEVLPSELATLTSLKGIRVFGNSIHGQLGSYLGDFQQLTNLNLGSNELTGPIPSSRLPSLRYCT